MHILKCSFATSKETQLFIDYFGTLKNGYCSKLVIFRGSSLKIFFICVFIVNIWLLFIFKTNLKHFIFFFLQNFLLGRWNQQGNWENICCVKDTWNFSNWRIGQTRKKLTNSFVQEVLRNWSFIFVEEGNKQMIKRAIICVWNSELRKNGKCFLSLSFKNYP